MKKACDERNKEDLSYEVREARYIEYVNNAEYLKLEQLFPNIFAWDL